MSKEPRTLQAMHRRLTAYEVIAKHENGNETRLAMRMATRPDLPLLSARRKPFSSPSRNPMVK